MSDACKHGNIGFCHVCGDYGSVIATRAARPSISEEDVVTLVAKVKALEATLARLTERLDGLDNRYVRYRVMLICPMCKARIAMLPEKASQGRLTCGNCNNSLPREAWSNE